jgi:hypothetical protein
MRQIMENFGGLIRPRCLFLRVLSRYMQLQMEPTSPLPTCQPQKFGSQSRVEATFQSQRVYTSPPTRVGREVHADAGSPRGNRLASVCGERCITRLPRENSLLPPTCGREVHNDVASPRGELSLPPLACGERCITRSPRGTSLALHGRERKWDQVSFRLLSALTSGKRCLAGYVSPSGLLSLPLA